MKTFFQKKRCINCGRAINRFIAYFKKRPMCHYCKTASEIIEASQNAAQSTPVQSQPPSSSASKERNKPITLRGIMNGDFEQPTSSHSASKERSKPITLRGIMNGDF